MPRIQHKRGTSANLASVNPTPLAGELVWDSTENAIKIGDGATAWTSLAYVTATPRSHASTHATGGSDALTPSDIGAAPAASPTFTGVITVPAGTVGTPSVTISGDNNTGLAQLGGADTFSIVCGGAERLRVDGTAINLYGSTRSGLRFNSAYTVGGTDIGVLSFLNNSSTLIGRMDCSSTAADETSTGVFRFQTRNSAGSSVNSLFVYPTGIAVQGGSASEPALRFLTDLNTGIAQIGGADTCSIVTAGSERLRAKSNGVIRYVPLTADPASGETGDVYFNSTLNKLRVYNGSRWVSLHGAAWDISTARYVQSFSVQAQETAPQSLFFKPDGTKFYVLGSTGDDVNQYDLAVPWDISTATYIQNFSVASQDNVPQGIFFRADGLKMFMVGSQTDAVYEYTLSTAWDLSTASYASNSFSVAAEDMQPTGVFFKPDGTKMFTVGVSSDYVDEYDLSTAWDISTAVLGHSHLVQGEEGNPHDLFFSPDGTRFFIVGDSGDGVDEYIMGVPWELSEITSNVTHAQFRSFSADEATLRGLAFSPDGTRMYLTGATNDTVIQYSLN